MTFPHIYKFFKGKYKTNYKTFYKHGICYIFTFYHSNLIISRVVETNLHYWIVGECNYALKIDLIFE